MVVCNYIKKFHFFIFFMENFFSIMFFHSISISHFDKGKVKDLCKQISQVDMQLMTVRHII